MIIGIDTSNYTTSAAAVEGEVYYNVRRILKVEKGQKGLRQSDAVFAHIKAFPSLYEQLFDALGEHGGVKAVGVSTAPRNAEGSYMPVFLAGVSFASAAALSLGVPLFKYSHQDGHIMAGVFSSGAAEFLDGEPFLSVHLSGGTTEILLSRYNGSCFDNSIIGGTKDISAGQLIDRVGVMLGMEFPCGRELSELARTAEKAAALPVTVDGAYINMSGTQTKAEQIYRAGAESGASVAAGVILAVERALAKAINNASAATCVNRVMLAGGVASNTELRDYIRDNTDAETVFASAELSTDNAVGIAKLAEYELYKK